ncbi:sodium:proton antiporter NhaD [Marinicella litoralis]|uniref:sodium:proton antiporter NhaD n=1 Tax=Marinicella litoralis TaxID=644220 RepID=UPI001FE90890|nr:sodium:proton antiporter NhaD [Marinicella litoralis]
MLIFIVAYVFVILEEKIHLSKSKPVLLAAGLIWIVIAGSQLNNPDGHYIEKAIRHDFLEYAELFFFLLVAMTYINAIAERGVFNALRDWLIAKGFSYRQLFWLTGFLAFFISPLADNLTTALIMCAVIMAVGKNNSSFISLSCINVVIAANAGGAFSPFGDITTLMVWQSGMIVFDDFFKLFVPALVNFLLPAVIMSFSIDKERPDTQNMPQTTVIKPGGLIMVVLFMATIVTAVGFHTWLFLPPVYGMMLGLGYLKLCAYFLSRKVKTQLLTHNKDSLHAEDDSEFDVFDMISRSEWDTLFFFYGVIMCVGGLGYIGYLALASEFFYGHFGPTIANISIGALSAIIDNIPVMFAVLTMNPEMSEVQWLLVTLTAGVGGSLLSIGSAAGVALMGQAKGHYTFFAHLKWTPVIVVGYLASVYTHFLINA